MVQTHFMFRMSPRSLSLSVNLFDRYMALTDFQTTEILIIGAACLMLAHKFDEGRAYSVNECPLLVSYDPRVIYAMEFTILTAIKYDVAVPVCHDFLMHYLDIVEADELTRVTAQYYADKLLLKFGCNHHWPCYTIAAACLYAALQSRVQKLKTRLAEARFAWPMAIVEETELTIEEVHEVARYVVDSIDRVNYTNSRRPLNSVTIIYSRPELLEVGSLPLPSL